MPASAGIRRHYCAGQRAYSKENSLKNKAIVYKRCSRCKKVKLRSKFKRYHNSKDGLDYYCAVCRRSSTLKYYHDNVEYYAAYRKKNKERYKAWNANWVEKNRKKYRAYQTAYRRAHPEKVKQWNANNRRNRALRRTTLWKHIRSISN